MNFILPLLACIVSLTFAITVDEERFLPMRSKVD